MSKIKKRAWVWRGWFLVEMPVLWRLEGYWRMLKEAERFFGSSNALRPCLAMARFTKSCLRSERCKDWERRERELVAGRCLSSMLHADLWSVCASSHRRSSPFSTRRLSGTVRSRRKGVTKSKKARQENILPLKAMKTAHTCHVLHHANHVRCIKQS